MLRRREFLRTGLLGAGALTFGPTFWSEALAGSPATPGPGPYGPLQPPDANGIMLPAGFKSRIVAQGNQPVPGTTYPWHIFSDGQATYATADGGFILVSNSEHPGPGSGGASAIRFRGDGSVADAYRILSGTQTNCAGGGTPWGTWLSCEEHDGGRVWECDPTGQDAAVARPAMGVFSHEAVAVDPGGKRVYLTEDNGEGGFYRFTPARYPDLSSGVLEIARAGEPGQTTNGGKVAWLKVPDPSAASTPTRQQVPATRFRRGEGIWFDSGIVYVATTGDHRIYAYDTGTGVIEVLYDAVQLESSGQETPLKDVDNVTVSRQSGDLFVCEDDGGDDPLDIAIITPDRQVARFLKVTGPQHGVPGTEAMSELAGVIFDPSGTRMYFSSQRAFTIGLIYEITGPFRLERQGQPTVPALRLDIEAPNSLSISSFRRRGLPVTADVNKAAELTLTLRAVGGPTLARARRSASGAGELTITLGPTAAGRRYLADRRRVRATLTVTAVDAAGTRRVATESVLLTGGAGGRPGGGSGRRRQRIHQNRSSRRRQRFRD